MARMPCLAPAAQIAFFLSGLRKIVHSSLKLLHSIKQRFDGYRLRVGHKFPIERYPFFSLDPEDDLAWDTDNNGVGRYLRDHHGIGANPGIVTDLHRAKHLRARAKPILR